MKLKVLHIINSMDTGGAEILLTNSLSPGGLCEYTENHLAFFMAPELVSRLDPKVKLHFLDYKGGSDIFRLIKQLRRIIVDNKIDVVHSHLNPSGTYASIACPSHVPQVHTIHTTYSMDKETGRFKLWLEKNIYLRRRNCNLIFLSDYTKADFLKHVNFKGRAFVLNNFVSDAFFDLNKKTKPQPLKQLRLIAIGTLRPAKNFEYLLEVFRFLQSHPVSLDIYGAGNKEPYQKVIDQYRLNVKMMGNSDNIEQVITQYDLFIMSSRFEGFPLSVFEAMAAGTPLMLSDIAPLRSIIKDNALYFELDKAEATAGQLLNILHQKIDIHTMAAKAKTYAAATAKREIYIKKLLGIYSEVVETVPA
jgi:glycosyltransferase involved in cell wall biosynthesis